MNYSKIGIIFAMLFIACSEDANPPINGAHGGSSEEPCVNASLENITVKGLAMASMRREPLDSSKQEVDLSISGMPRSLLLYNPEISLMASGLPFTLPRNTIMVLFSNS